LNAQLYQYSLLHSAAPTRV